MGNQDIRWKQRFENFSKAFALLSEINKRDTGALSNLEKEGFIQRFEVVFELAWKTAKDYLEYSGLDVQPTPRAVVKEAFAAKIIEDGQAFINMLEARNRMSHIYDEQTFKAIFLQLKDEFYPAIEQLYNFLREQL
jgi:nucleotidyltransferase substrate binding protein (TIGR01987 family)